MNFMEASFGSDVMRMAIAGEMRRRIFEAGRLCKHPPNGMSRAPAVAEARHRRGENSKRAHDRARSGPADEEAVRRQLQAAPPRVRAAHTNKAQAEED
jgi:hypothetical protein